MPRFAVYVLALGVVALSLWYVNAPPRSPAAYRERAATTVATLRSQVQTARMWAREVGVGRATHPAAKVGLEEAEEDAAAAAASFERLDPPAGTREARVRVTAAAGEVGDVLAALRIAAHDGAWGDVQAAASALLGLAARLEALRHQVRP
jgi:hypothetical protein